MCQLPLFGGVSHPTTAPTKARPCCVDVATCSIKRNALGDDGMKALAAGLASKTKLQKLSYAPALGSDRSP